MPKSVQGEIWVNTKCKFTQEELDLIAAYCAVHGMSQTQVISLGLRKFLAELPKSYDDVVLAMRETRKTP